MTKKKETLEEQVDRLSQEVGDLYEAVRLLATNCSCSVAERMSGHHVDCTVPLVLEIISPTRSEESA